MKVKRVFQCDVSIRHKLCLKLQKVDKCDVARHKRRNVRRHNIRNIIYGELKHRTEKWVSLSST